jgi:ankyrin repeat protein
VTAAGEPIDQKDDDNFDALAYALQNRDYDAVRRLLALGARADTPVGAAALDFAKQQGNEAMLSALGSGQTTL